MLRYLLKNTRWLVAALSVGAAFGAFAGVEHQSCQDLERTISMPGAPHGITLAKQCVAAARASHSSVWHVLQKAIDYREEDIALALVNIGAALSEPRAAILAASGAELPRLITALLKQDASLVNVIRNGDTPLQMAALGSAYMATRVLLENGADPNLVSPGPLRISISNNSLQIAYLLLESGASWKDLPSEKAASLFGVATAFTHVPFLQYLLASPGDFDVNSVDTDGAHILLYTGKQKIESYGKENWFYLVHYGADPVLFACSLSADVVERIQEFAPKWFANKVDFYRAKCGGGPPNETKHVQTREHPSTKVLGN